MKNVPIVANSSDQSLSPHKQNEDKIESFYRSNGKIKII